MKPIPKKNIVLVDDHIIIRDGLKALIEKLGPYTISAQFDDGTSFIKQYESLQPKPDLIIMDLSMPHLSGLEVMQIWKDKRYETPVLILTLNEAEDNIVKLFRLGVKGYLKKSCSAA
jgi:two-component system, NarL family, invasion response regulator UvrY